MKARVGIIGYALHRPLTGIGRYTVRLIQALLRLDSGVDLIALAAGGLGPLSGAQRLRAVPLRGCHLLPGLLTLGQMRVRAVARQLGLGLVHDPTGVTPFLFGAAGVRTVVTVHDVFAWSCPGNSTQLDTLIYRRWLPLVLPRVDVVITPSCASRADIVRFLKVDPHRISVIPQGVAAEFRPPRAGAVQSARAQYGLPDRYLLFLGSVEKRKNLTGLLEAYAQLRKRGGDVPLVIAGPAQRRYPVLAETLRRLELEPYVIFLGYVCDADLPALYGGAELFVFPSLYEGFGLPPLEAMACGTPLVCSHAASLPEVVGDAALLVDPTDVAGLADAMLTVLSQPELRQQLRRRGLARAAEFTWERTARETLAVYHQTLAS